MKLLIVANWKCNPTSLKGAKLLFDSVEKGVKNIKNVEAVVCPPFVFISDLRAQDPSSAISFGGQSCFWEKSGPYTGEISPSMLKNLGCKYVILGHSERRALGETDEMINKKTKAAIGAGLKPILSVENLPQSERCLKNISDEVIVAFEPIFAVGTGKPCSVEKARKARESFSRFRRVLYGGSVNSKNARDYIEKAGFQGLLVGAVSLKPQEFLKLINSIDPVRIPPLKVI